MKRIFNQETTKDLGKEVKVSGWVNTKRSHGKIIFVDLRDKTGFLQLVFSPDNKEAYEIAKDLRTEWVIEVVGKVLARPKGMQNKKVETGKVELKVAKIKVLSEAETLPITIDDEGYDITEEKRLKYRYLDLRRPRMRRNLEIRQKVNQFIRQFLIEEGFIEIETPILTRSTPEGARDYLVPSRLQIGKFYALPQSPQQYKQLLQVAGFERYFQIARCFRDEDSRKDRQPELTQLDIEMSFIEQEDVLSLIEKLFTSLVKEIFPEKKILKTPFPRMTYKEAMKKYKTDKPDLRKSKDSNELAFAFVVDFPMFEWHEKEKKWGAMHHPFTKPQAEKISEIKKSPEKILAFQYDFVLNGVETAGGSIRCIDPDVLTAIFEVLGHNKEEVKEQFGHLLKAFEYGVPPHGGIALGVDRFIATCLGEPSIREAIAFPKTGDARDPMMGTPANASKDQLKELHLKIDKK